MPAFYAPVTQFSPRLADSNGLIKLLENLRAHGQQGFVWRNTFCRSNYTEPTVTVDGCQPGGGASKIWQRSKKCVRMAPVASKTWSLGCSFPSI